MQNVDWLIDRPQAVRAWYLFAHGAGAPMDSTFMGEIASLLCARGIGVARFEFPYMAQRRHGGKKRPPEKVDKLVLQYGAALQAFLDGPEFAGEPVFIGGKSMGGRIAAMLAGSALPEPVRGVCCLGYPFHPQGKPDTLRLEPLNACRLPVLVVQGTRDRLGNREEVDQYPLSDRMRCHWLADGDHDLKPRRQSGYSHAQHLAETADAIVNFTQG
ncbi:hypothetical protein MNKW57_13210 [Biformimicrobium ophioploci]|uniref:KANL3/Tex30 alpha/beta hydrolase-like domain-containing protein n=2 Tax=Biformimicrobium ophioploci TaxID=3036711 RepID=A0ABQ6LY46_9GAMM|nr:hypothetical protein MNKW57_13210 [Microbulbifer sp. NKW57]